MFALTFPGASASVSSADRNHPGLLIEAGRTIDPEEVLGPSEGRNKLFIVGDGETPNGLAEHVRDADALLIEAMLLDRDAATARDYGYLTAAEAAARATTSDAELFVLTHISGCYANKEALAEATKTFPNSRVATDFDYIVV